MLRPTEDGVHDSCQQRSWTPSRAAGSVALPMAPWLSGSCTDSLFTAAHSSDVSYTSPVERFFWGGKKHVITAAKIPGIQTLTEIPAHHREMQDGRAFCCIVGNIVQLVLRCQSGLR